MSQFLKLVSTIDLLYFVQISQNLGRVVLFFDFLFCEQHRTLSPPVPNTTLNPVGKPGTKQGSSCQVNQTRPSATQSRPGCTAWSWTWVGRDKQGQGHLAVAGVPRMLRAQKFCVCECVRVCVLFPSIIPECSSSSRWMPVLANLSEASYEVILRNCGQSTLLMLARIALQRRTEAYTSQLILRTLIYFVCLC